MRNRFSSILAISAVVLISAAPSALAARAHIVGLSAPVIHEPFSPLGCSGKPGRRSTIQMEGCAEARILSSDQQIDALNKSIFGRLSTPSAKRDFIAGHQAWLGYRKAYCISMSDIFQDGSEANVVFAKCAAGVNTQHIEDLRTFLSALTSA